VLLCSKAKYVWPVQSGWSRSKIDLYQFDPYGEVVVSGEGERPPSEVTQKVAEMYNADASTFFQPIDPKQEIANKIEQLKAQEEAQS